MKKKEIITQYQRGKDYTLWYYFRYYPSINKLKRKLREKTLNNHELIEKIFDEVWHLFNDLPVLESKIENLLFRNKNIKYIKTNLLQKEFNKEDIEKILESFTTPWESVLNENFLYKKIIQLKNKNKSIQYIKNKLIEQPEDKIIVEKIINEIYTDNWEDEVIKKEYEKLLDKNFEQQKIIQKLLQKWFNYWWIKKILK